jgi:hypothetical protein
LKKKKINLTKTPTFSTAPLNGCFNKIAFDVFHTGQGAQGLLIRPSKQELENTFGSSKVRT